MGKRSPGRTPWSPRSLRRTSLTSNRELYRHGRRAVRYEDGEKTVVVPENAPIITYGVGSRAMLVSGARHHYGNTEAGRLSDATTRRRRTERADTADVTATPPSARQEHFASDLRSRWSGPGGHGRGVPSIVIGMWRRRSAALPPAPGGWLAQGHRQRPAELKMLPAASPQ